MSDIRKQTKGKLSDLDEATQEHVFERLQKGESYAEIIAWLVARNYVESLSDTTLSKWFQRYAAKLRDEQRQSRLERLIADFRAKQPLASPEEIAAIGDAFFTAAAVGDEDNKAYVRVQKLQHDRRKFEADHNRLVKEFELKERSLAQKDAQLANDERRIAMLEANAAKAKTELMAVAKDGGLSAETLKRIEEAAGLL